MAERQHDREHEREDGNPSGVTGGTLAGEEVVGGSVLKGGPSGDEDRPKMSHAPDSTGRSVTLAPEYAGTVAGNTTGAGGTVLGGLDDREDSDEDLAERERGLEGVTIQEIGGEARR